MDGWETFSVTLGIPIFRGKQFQAPTFKGGVFAVRFAVLRIPLDLFVTFDVFMYYLKHEHSDMSLDGT